MYADATSGCSLAEIKLLKAAISLDNASNPVGEAFL